MSPSEHADETPSQSTRLTENEPLIAGYQDGRLIVGLTGGIGSGKSTVAELFARHGAAIIDADEISHQLTQPAGAAIPAIRAAFGDLYIDPNGALNRARMRTLVFADAEARQRLEQLLHPLILAQAKMRLSQAASAPYRILVVPLLAQAPEFRRLVQRVLVVDCDERHQIERVVRHRGLTETEARAIIASQTPRTERQRLADDIITNEGDLSSLSAQVDALHQRYLENSD
ncbi:MAG TPA: dephospho-CoA kinase [Gallionella sp.]|nr:dephospho-CoA kinase [Gallionella sp.]